MTKRSIAHPRKSPNEEEDQGNEEAKVLIGDFHMNNNSDHHRGSNLTSCYQANSCWALDGDELVQETTIQLDKGSKEMEICLLAAGQPLEMKDIRTLKRCALEGWPCNRESFSEFNRHSTEVPTFPFLAFLVPGCNRQAETDFETCWRFTVLLLIAGRLFGFSSFAGNCKRS